MAKQNKPTHKAQQQALIDRTPPYDGNPLIQKAEDDEVRDQGIDNVYYEVPTTGSINAPAATFTVDFANVNGNAVEEVNIDTSGSASSSFSVTLSNLEGNVIGKLNITKKSGDTFSFANATILPYDDTTGQSGSISIAFSIVKIGAAYYAVKMFEGEVDGSQITSSSITATQMGANSVGDSELIGKRVKQPSSDPQLVTKTLRIGDWNMDTTLAVNVTHGLDVTKIRGVRGIVRNDAGTTIFALGHYNVSNQNIDVAISGVGSTSVTLERRTGGYFDSTLFDSTSYNRGDLLVDYEE